MLATVSYAAVTLPATRANYVVVAALDMLRVPPEVRRWWSRSRASREPPIYLQSGVCGPENRRPHLNACGARLRTCEVDPVSAAILAHLGLAGCIDAQVAGVGSVCATCACAARRYPKLDSLVLSVRQACPAPARPRWMPWATTTNTSTAASTSPTCTPPRLMARRSTVSAPVWDATSSCRWRRRTAADA